MRAANSSELDLYAHAQAAAVNAYAPYSHFPVGAALQPEGGVEPIVGVNVENGSFGMTLCAERTAVFTAVTAGHRRFVAIAVYADAETALAVRRLPAGAGRVLAGYHRHLPPRGRGRRRRARRAPAGAIRPVTGAEHRSGLIALAGRPNVGKSTLVNRIVGDHVAAVSARPQTTRRRALGVVHRPGVQLVLVDLPGFQKPFDRLTERMQRSVNETLADADATVLVLDARTALGAGDRFIAGRVLAEGAPPCVIALNKTDGLGADRIVPALAAAVALGNREPPRGAPDQRPHRRRRGRSAGRPARACCPRGRRGSPRA